MPWCRTREELREVRIAAGNDTLVLRIAPSWMKPRDRGDIECEYIARFCPHVTVVDVPSERSPDITYLYSVCSLPCFVVLQPDGKRLDDGTLFPMRTKTGSMRQVSKRVRTLVKSSSVAT